MVLEVSRVSGGYGATAQVLEDVDLHIGAGEIVTLLGRNGVGKTTLMRAVMGLLPTVHGTVSVSGVDVSELPTFRRARSGLGYVPQGRELFARSSLEQNLRYGHVLAGRSMRAPLPAAIDEWFPWLRDRLGQRAGTLSGGEQQMVALARVLVGQPAILLLDEPTEGLAPVVVRQLVQTIRSLAGTGSLGILIVEQNVQFALELAARGYVMEKGRIVAEGAADELASERILTRYLLV